VIELGMPTKSRKIEQGMTKQVLSKKHDCHCLKNGLNGSTMT
jgi:hypothetical protein